MITGGFSAVRTLLAAVVAAGLATAAVAQESKGGGNQFSDDEEEETSSSASSGGSNVEIIGGNDTAAIMASFERNGFQVELSEDDGGDPLIRSADTSEPFNAYFYKCPGESTDYCFMQLNAGWNLDDGITLAKVEDWNANKVWGQAYRDDEKDPWLSMAVNLKGGVTAENLDDTIDWWRVILVEFRKHIGFDAE